MVVFQTGEAGTPSQQCMNDLKNLQNNIKLEQNVKILLTWN